MAKDVRFLISANVERAEQEIRKLQNTGKAVSDSLGSAFEQLGIRSTVAIEKEKTAAVAAYERIKASGVASAAEISRAKAALSATTAKLDRENINLSRSMQTVKQSSDSLGSSIGMLAGPGAMLAAVAATAMYGKACVAAALESERVSVGMKAVAGSSQASARELQFIREESQRLGLNFIDLAGAYAKFSASTKNTAIEGEATRKIFSGVSEAVTALRLPAEQANGIFLALSQMMSKGKVSAEELRGQLGERLPGAFKLAADAMGLTTDELDKQITNGNVMASDLLPKLAEELHKTYGTAAKEAASGGQAEINRFNNTVQDSKRLMGEVFLPVLVEVLQTFNNGTSILKPFVGTLQNIGASAYAVVEKFTALKDAGGLIGLITGGSEARQELKDQFKAIDELAEWNKDKNYNRLNPNVSSQKSVQELAAEKVRVAEAVAKEVAAKEKAVAEKLAKAQEEYDKLIKEREINRLKDQAQIKHEILRNEEKFASTALHALQAKKKEIQNLQAAFLESDRSFEEKRRQILGDFSGGFAYLDPNATAQQKAVALQDRLIELEKEYQQISDPKEKQQKLAALAETWSGLTDKIDFANMSQAEKMMQINRIEEERSRLQTSVIQAAEQESQILSDTYDTAISKVQEYKSEVQALDAVIRNMSREITIDMKINKAGLELLKAGGTLPATGHAAAAAPVGGSRTDFTDYSGGTLHAAVAGDNYNPVTSNDRAAGMFGDFQSASYVAASVIGKGDKSDVYGSHEKGSYGGYSPYSGVRTEYYGGTNTNGDGVTGSVVNGIFYPGASPINNQFSADFDRLPSGYMSISSTPSYEVGTNRVPRDGYAYLHKDEAVVPKKYNPAAGGQGSGGVTINGGLTLSMPNITDKTSIPEMARQILPELQKLQSRFRKV